MAQTIARNDAPAPVAAPAQPAGVVRRATADDVPAMKALINSFARRNRMLFRSAAELAEYVDEYQVYLEGERLLGVSGVHPVHGGLAEVRGLAVAEDAPGRGSDAGSSRAASPGPASSASPRSTP